MQGTYSRLNVPVEVLQIDQSDLNTKRMMDLMAVGQEGGSMPLYMHTVKRILREMRILQQESGTAFDYSNFKQRVLNSDLTPAQLEPLKQRLDTLESFMPRVQTTLPNTQNKGFGKKSRVSRGSNGSSWELVVRGNLTTRLVLLLISSKPSRLTIVDLSCPCISPETACSLFNVCLAIFLEQEANVGRIVALDEAHKVRHSRVSLLELTLTKF